MCESSFLVKAGAVAPVKTMEHRPHPNSFWKMQVKLC